MRFIEMEQYADEPLNMQFRAVEVAECDIERYLSDITYNYCVRGNRKLVQISNTQILFERFNEKRKIYSMIMVDHGYLYVYNGRVSTLSTQLINGDSSKFSMHNYFKEMKNDNS